MPIVRREWMGTVGDLFRQRFDCSQTPLYFASQLVFLGGHTVIALSLYLSLSLSLSLSLFLGGHTVFAYLDIRQRVNTKKQDLE